MSFLNFHSNIVRISKINKFPETFRGRSFTIDFNEKRPLTADCEKLPAPYRTTEGVSNHFMARIGIFLLYEGSISVQVSQLSRKKKKKKKTKKTKNKTCVADKGMIHWSDILKQFKNVNFKRF